MRKLTSFVCLLMLSLPLLAHGNQPGKATLEVGNGEIQIVYTAPELKGRDINELIKMPGANPWRLGADRATVLETPVALNLGGESIPAGKYTLRAQLDDSGSWWLQFVDESRAVAGQLKLNASTASDSEEHLVIALSGSASDANLKIQWGKQILSGEFSAE